MSILTAAIYDALAGDATLTGLLTTYEGEPAIFTVFPAPRDAELPYIVSAGDVAGTPFDTKTTRGREVWRDVKCYASTRGSVVTIEAIADRVYVVLHRQELFIGGHGWVLSECTGPIAADERDAYGRIVTVRVVAEEAEEWS